MGDIILILILLFAAGLAVNAILRAKKGGCGGTAAVAAADAAAISTQASRIAAATTETESPSLHSLLPFRTI